MSDDNPIQLVDPYIEWGLDRSSLPELKQTITSLKDAGEKDAALDVSAWVSDPMILGQFIETVFHHAENGYVQLRMFIDGEEKRTFDWPWKAVPVSDRIELLTAAISKASRAALSKNK